VGGICESGFVSIEATKEYLSTKSTEDLRELLHLVGDSVASMEVDCDDDDLAARAFLALQKRKYIVEGVSDSIFGLAFGGDVPVQSIVSRGVKSTIGGQLSTEQPSCWVVEHVDFLRPGEQDYMFRGDSDMLKPTHVIRSVRNRETGKIVSPLALLEGTNHRPEFVGLRRPNSDGYELHPLSPFSLQTNVIVLMTDGTPEQDLSIENADIDLFSLDAKSCNDHMDCVLEQLKAATAQDVILGGLMFSCSGRGPERRSLLREEMADAKRFHKHFPDVNLCGFYAGGEIGPMAMVGKRDVFQSGKAAIQGFTAVFALFIVPARKSGTFHLDDGPENVIKFVTESLSSCIF